MRFIFFNSFFCKIYFLGDLFLLGEGKKILFFEIPFSVGEKFLAIDLFEL